MFELDTRIFSTKMPVDTTLFLVAILTPRFEFIAQVFKAGESTVSETLSCQRGKFNLGYV